jgi:predicted nucleotide-binding protein
MMPFKNSLTYRSVAMAIREACEGKGFKAIRVDDHDRQFRDQLWDNLVVNMLSCKYAVAVYVSEQVVDRLDDNEPKMFPNPNVALEYGFFRSRGQAICLLKDKKSPIPSDLQGFLWNEFDIEDPKDDVITAVNLFLEKVSKEKHGEPDA